METFGKTGFKESECCDWRTNDECPRHRKLRDVARKLKENVEIFGRITGLEPAPNESK